MDFKMGKFTEKVQQIENEKFKQIFNYLLTSFIPKDLSLISD